MAADPALVAIRLRYHRAINPPEHQAWLRAAKRVIYPDATVDLSKGVGTIPDDAAPALDPTQISGVEGLGYDTVHDHLSALTSGTAPVGATYITQTGDPTLTNEQALSSLASGIVKVTTATGVLSSVAAPAGAVVGTTDTQNLTNKTVTDTLKAFELQGTGGAPAFTAGAALGTTPGAQTISGSDLAASIIQNAGTAPTTGVLWSVVFATAKSLSGYKVALQALSSNSKALQLYVTNRQTTGFDIACGVAPTASVQQAVCFVVVVG